MQELPARRRSRPLHLRRVQVQVGNRMVDQLRRVDLEQAARAEEGAHAGQQRGALAQAFERRAGPPVQFRLLAARLLHCDQPGTEVSAPIAWPTRSVAPGASAASQAPMPGGNNRITVDPILKRPTSAPRASWAVAPAGNGSALAARARRLAISPCHTVAMLPTNSAPTRISACVPRSPLNSSITRSLRANSLGTKAALTSLTLNRRPGTD